MGTVIDAIRNQRKPAPSSEAPDILAVLHNADSAAALRAAVPTGSWRLTLVDSIDAASALAARRPFNIVILEENVSGGWQSPVQHFANLASRPAVLLIPERANEKLLSDVVRTGGYGLLPVPLQSDSVISAIHAGWMFWLNQHHLRQLTK